LADREVPQEAFKDIGSGGVEAASATQLAVSQAFFSHQVCGSLRVLQGLLAGLIYRSVVCSSSKVDSDWNPNLMRHQPPSFDTHAGGNNNSAPRVLAYLQ